MQQYGVSLNYLKLGLGIQNQFILLIQQINVQHEIKIGPIYLENAHLLSYWQWFECAKITNNYLHFLWIRKIKFWACPNSFFLHTNFLTTQDINNESQNSDFASCNSDKTIYLQDANSEFWQTQNCEIKSCNYIFSKKTEMWEVHS